MTVSKEAIEVAREIERRFISYVDESIDAKKSISHRSVSLEAQRDAQVDALNFAKDNLRRIVKEVLEAREQTEAKRGGD